MKTLQGIAASRGIAIGSAFRFQKADLCFERSTIRDPAVEWARFQAALDTASKQLAAVCARAEAVSGAENAAIFQAHALMLDDPELLDAVRTAIEEQCINAESALSDASEMYIQLLESLDNEYLSTRAADVRDVTERVLRILLGVVESPIADLTTPSIILARDLPPSDTVLLDKSLVLGFCTAEGGPTAHTAILARGLGLPAIVGIGPDLLEVADHTTLILDGGSGTLVVEPDEKTVAMHRTRQAVATTVLAQARERAHEPAITRDGHRVEIVANIGNVEGAWAALEAGAEGVGLLRTEFLYLERDRLPDEEEQYQAYRAIVYELGNLPVILRTLDIGGDKELPYLDLPQEMNPFLGVRAIRLCLARPELFKPQLRAALRAGAGRNLKLMFPMVATVAEVRAARAILAECQAELLAEGQPIAEEMEVGIMVEIPAAALMADHLAAEIDFFSIGDNDLSQYTLAADRANANVASLASGFQPAVLRLVRDVITAAHVQGKWVGLCGELAGEPLAVPILLGLGLDEFSMNPPAIPLVKQIIRALTLDEARAVAQAALELDNPDAVRALVRERVTAANL
ncbi:MAG: phosphoenolpyruvate--protein phosphotransferase [Anaerolineaceae bacterium 4572_32.2]|nr:MAG: phosphoenolpyruvate--protein phosphotransferase [Anaerolineaceae bacterium 4572_32.2]HEY73803.1 phosphoenolpyruvate--protein phosphotransferase [Thermoflexia bacterium]